MPLRDARLLDHDVFTGITSWYHFDPETGGFVIEYEQDSQQLLDHNQALYNEGDSHTPWGDGAFVASLDNIAVMKLAELGIMTPACVILDQKRFKAWLNDSTNQRYRVRPGRI